MASLCRECARALELPSQTKAARCPYCGSMRITTHEELFDLKIAHMDCDAFYASVEKRENPELADKPVIIGGGRRGVVSTACYIARIRGVRSAMPMFQALKLCPDAVIVKPRMSLYVEVSREIRKMMESLTPAVQPLSLDEAFLDLTGTQRLHGAPPAIMLARLVKRMKEELGVTGSIGLSHNKFLAKVASDLDKPRGFSLIGQKETADFLRDKPVRLIWGIGPSAQQSLEKVGIRSFSDLLRWDREELVTRFGSTGERLWHLARGEDHRRVSANEPVKSISKETTFNEDTADPEVLDGHLWRLSVQVADRAKARNLSGRVVTLKLKRIDHSSITRRHKLRSPTHMADTIYSEARALLDHASVLGPFRLIGCGLSELCEDSGAESQSDLLAPNHAQRINSEHATDAIRARFGPDAILKGRALR
ncbi:MAG: DNA polymerase IV [Heliomarina sp.]|uniref:DNA polymerase IV n=1 Tax=Heliomarina sp. TaxID=2917556 RepID=UPI0040591351